MENFPPSVYGATGKIWEIKSSSNGLLYCASEKGLLEYDGRNWQKFKGSKGFLRSVFVKNDSLIYTGSDMDFGVWKRNSLLEFEYKSLYPFKEKAGIESEEFWTTTVINGDPVFVSHNNLYTYHKNKTSKIAAPTHFSESFVAEGNLYITDEKMGLYLYDGTQLRLVFPFSGNKSYTIFGVYHFQNELYLVTKNDGILKYSNGVLTSLNSAVSNKLKSEITFSFTQIDSSHLAFGTVLNGFYITNIKGEIIHHVNRQKGLLNNTILSLYYDPAGNLWSAMDFGLSKMNFKNRINYFLDFTGSFGTGYSSVLKDDVFYLGTNQGLYRSFWKDMNNNQPQNSFQIIPGSEGQVWSLENVEGDVLVGHDLGLFKLFNGSVEQISNIPGVWTIKLYQKNILLTGNYNGVSVFKKINGTWKFVKRIKTIAGSCNQIEIQGNVLWVNIPNYGVVRVSLDSNLDPIQRKIFATQNFKGEEIQLSQDKYGVQITTRKNSYKYDNKLQKFVPNGRFTFNNDVKDLLYGFNHQTSINSEYIFYPIYNGFALKNVNQNPNDFITYPLKFRGLEIFNNDEKVKYSLAKDIPYRYNNLKLNFIVPQVNNAIYQYHFENKEWSSFTVNPSFELLNLKEGRYELYARALINGKYTNTVKISFYVKPPWYRSFLAYVGCFLAFLGLLFWLRKRQNRLLKEQEIVLLNKEAEALRLQQEKHEQEKIILEQERLEREKEILQQKVKDKTIELAQKAKDDEDKNRLLITVTEKVQEIEADPNIAKIRLKEIRRLLNNYIESEDHTFEIQMDELHQEFFRSIKKEFPTLSIYDLRLCAYLRIGLTSKEMADIFQVLPSSINVSRSRLRKKLNLGPEVDLFDFLNRF